MASDLYIDDRVIPAQRVRSYLQFMNHVRHHESSDISLAFPNHGIYHDLVGFYWNEFREAFVDNHTLHSVEIPALEPHDPKSDDFWRSVGDVLNEAPALNKILLSRCPATDFEGLCDLLGQLTEVTTIVLTFTEYETRSGRRTHGGSSVVQPWSTKDVASLAAALRKLQGVKKKLKIVGYLLCQADELLCAILDSGNFESFEWTRGEAEYISYEFTERVRVSPSLECSLQLTRLHLAHELPWLDDSCERLIVGALSRSTTLSNFSTYLSSHQNPSFWLNALGKNKHLDVLNLIEVIWNDDNWDEWAPFLEGNTSLTRLVLTPLETIDMASLGQLVGSMALQELLLFEKDDYAVTSDQIYNLFKGLACNEHIQTIHVASEKADTAVEQGRRPVEMLQNNFSLHEVHIHVHELSNEQHKYPWIDELSIIADLNRLGRGYLQDDSTNRSRMVDVLLGCQHSLDHLYFHLRENPGFASLKTDTPR